MLLLHPEAQNTYKIIKAHKAVTEKVKSPVEMGDGGFKIKFEIEVPLPSKARANGVSKTGVRAHEPVIFYFPPAYPFHAPKIMLRHDFNKSLAHINPLDIEKERYVNPCVYYGNLDDLLHQTGDGLNEIINHLSEWLGKASIDDLIDPTQGWEPIRRDAAFGWIVYDLAGMRSLVQDTENALVFQCGFIQYTFIKKHYFAWGLDINKPKTNISAGLVEQSIYEVKKENDIFGGSLAFISWSDKFDAGQEKVVDQYLSETVQNLKQLFERAEDYGCGSPLKNLFIELRWAYSRARLKINPITIFVILCVRRPYKLIDDDSSLELIPYKVDCKFNEVPSTIESAIPEICEDSQVFPLGHRHELNSNLLKKMSGVKKEINSGTIVSVGCGSVGSKICLYLARSGIGPFCLIDKGIFSPHNAARHALIGFMEIPHLRKADMLAKEIKYLHQKAEPCFDDIIDRCKQVHDGGVSFPKDSRLIIDTTGSTAVREMLASLPLEQIPGRLMHAALFEQGKVGIMAIEGLSRNPNISDLVIRFWDERIDDNDLHKRFSKNSDALTRQEIGLGCGSHTMVMTDMRVSLFSAGIAERARQVMENGASPSGELWIGLLDDYEISFKWEQITLHETVALKKNGSNGWEVRILKKAVDQIENEIKLWDKVETGGVLIGRISLSRHCITISRVLDAPSDSERSESRFVLGVDKLTKRVIEIRKKSGNTLTYVGTWHSHPKGGHASSIDKIALQKISQLRFGFPTLGLIWTPSGFTTMINEGN